MRTLAQLSKEALDVQDACNLSGVAIGLVDVVFQLRELLPEAGTDEINTHPIVQLWVDKLRRLARSDWVSYPLSDVYRQVKAWSEQG